MTSPTANIETAVNTYAAQQNLGLGKVAQPLRVAISGGITKATNSIYNTVTASISNAVSMTSALGVVLSVIDTPTITATLVSVSLAVGVVGVAVGVSLVENIISDTVSTLIQNSSVTANGGSISATSTYSPTISATGVVGALSASIGVAGVGAEAKSTISGTNEAYVYDATLSAPDFDVSIQAITIAKSAPVFSSLVAGLVAV